jgi:hypothetical protein
VCPVVAPINLIFVARRLGAAFVQLPTIASPAAAGAARRAGLGEWCRGVPPREDPLFDQLRKRGRQACGELWDKPSTWWTPPEYVLVDVERTLLEGHIVAVPPR